MELKDVILSTLAEMEDVDQKPKTSSYEVKETISKVEDKSLNEIKPDLSEEISESSPQSELIYLNSIRERLLVLFEGFQAPNNTNIEAKVDMTLNFLEYVLATIDNRVDVLEKGRRE